MPNKTADLLRKIWLNKLLCLKLKMFSFFEINSVE